MRKIIYLCAVILSGIMFSSCNSDDATLLLPSNDIRYSKGQYDIAYVYAGSVNTLYSSNGTRAGSSNITYDKIQYHWDNPVDIFERFPESKTPEGTYGDYVFESNGQPFNIIMLYSNGSYRHDMGIYYYDLNGDAVQVKLWDERNVAISDWRNENGSKTPKGISRLSDNAGAYRVTLPEGTKFGFYQISYNTSGEIVTEPVRLNPPAGPIVSCDYKFYTEAEKNWNYLLLQDKPLKTQSMSYQVISNNQSWTIIGMEDISLTKPGCDKDFNDVVFALNPSPKMIAKDDNGNEEIVIPEGNYTGEVEFDIHHQKHNEWEEIKTSIHLRDTVDAKVFIPIPGEYQCDPDDFAIRISQPDNIYYREKVKVGAEWYDVTYSIEHKDNGIEIFIKGSELNEVLRKSREIYNDGITLEVHSYVIGGVREEDIWNWISQSTHETDGKTEHKGQITSAFRNDTVKIKDFGNTH